MAPTPPPPNEMPPCHFGHLLHIVCKKLTMKVTFLCKSQTKLTTKPLKGMATGTPLPNLFPLELLILANEFTTQVTHRHILPLIGLLSQHKTLNISQYIYSLCSHIFMTRVLLRGQI